MPDVIDDLATISGVQAYLQNNPTFSAHTVKKLSGGTCNFTYRIYLCRAFNASQTLVLKYAPPYIASSGGNFLLDQKRQLIEVQALRLAARMFTASTPTSITVPTVHMFDEEKYVVIMDDVGENCQTLKELLIKESLSTTLSRQIGTALGEFISAVHTWHQNTDIDLTVFANNRIGKDISVFATYGRLESTLTGKHDIPTLLDPLLGVSEAKMATISKVAEKRQQAIHAASASDPLTHGDVWPGNLVISLNRRTDGTVEGIEKLYLLDWELCKTGLPGLDLGQFCAEMYILSEFFPARKESTRTIVESFLGTYKERRETGGDTTLARIALSHIGAHTVIWAPRASSWSGRERTREVVEKGVGMLVLGEEGSELSLKTSIVGPLLDS